MQITHKNYRFILLVFSLISGNVLTHDFWIEAHPFYTEPGKTVELSLYQGSQYMGDTLPNVINGHNDFSIFFAHKTEEVPDEPGRDPTG